MKNKEVLITLTYKYEINPENYPEGLTTKQMIEMDIKSFREDPDALFELVGDSPLTISGKII
ncbi:MAG: hypothetical protein UR21_C0024G0003 [Candidatus Woesebacteria bacterium GW2011_GWC2_31_9]|uniref:Uncharacterized protein n=1 Tax=Candidatus Woesebacteria bacterium GW2011_GWC2_31_9 TaxID=1618586 RepID=A0A0G0AW12_9BACT|nr:MAG: hypothetical protein UR21_C0024G0003 [Candidatus Woesebacteria bacterium GW2011_GWC2_31_9]